MCGLSRIFVGWVSGVWRECGRSNGQQQQHHVIPVAAALSVGWHDLLCFLVIRGQGKKSSCAVLARVCGGMEGATKAAAFAEGVPLSGPTSGGHVPACVVVGGCRTALKCVCVCVCKGHVPLMGTCFVVVCLCGVSAGAVAATAAEQPSQLPIMAGLCACWEPWQGLCWGPGRPQGHAGVVTAAPMWRGTFLRLFAGRHGG